MLKTMYATEVSRRQTTLKRFAKFPDVRQLKRFARLKCVRTYEGHCADGPLTPNIQESVDRVSIAIHGDRQMTICEKLKSYDTCRTIFTKDVGMSLGNLYRDFSRPSRTDHCLTHQCVRTRRIFGYAHISNGFSSTLFSTLCI